MQKKTLIKLIERFTMDGILDYTSLSFFVENTFQKGSSFDHKALSRTFRTKKRAFEKRSGDIPIGVFCENKRKCGICDWRYNIHIHHINKNKLDNTPYNLIGLCPNHHMIIHSNKKIKNINFIKELLELRNKLNHQDLITDSTN